MDRFNKKSSELFKPLVGGNVVLALPSGDDPLLAFEKTILLKVVQNGVERAGTEFVPVAGEFINQRRAVNRLLRYVVQDMNLDNANSELIDRVAA